MKKIYLLAAVAIGVLLSACSSSNSSLEKPHKMTVKLNNFSKTDKSKQSTEKVGVMALNKKQKNDLQARLNNEE